MPQATGKMILTEQLITFLFISCNVIRLLWQLINVCSLDSLESAIKKEGKEQNQIGKLVRENVRGTRYDIK